MMRKNYLPGVAAAMILFVGTAIGQKPPNTVSFEVASIKSLGQFDAVKMVQQGIPLSHLGMHVDGARVDIGVMTLADLIGTAYKVKKYQITGPDWISVDRFDILAKIPEGRAIGVIGCQIALRLSYEF